VVPTIDLIAERRDSELFIQEKVALNRRESP
jgi:hypothetical protein